MALKAREVEIKKKLPEWKKFLDKIGVGSQNINDENLLATAFSHKSFAADYKDNVPYNERLEFVGDGILWGVVAKYLYLMLPWEAESLLTLYKIALVREEMLAEVARELGLPQMLLVGRWERKKWWMFNEKILADWLEALIGYIYLDIGYPKVDEFIKTYIITKLPVIAQRVNIKSYKTLLQEIVQKKYKTLPRYEDYVDVVDEKWTPKRFKSEVFVGKQKIAEWFGHNKKKAQEDAAQKAYEAIKNLNNKS